MKRPKNRRVGRARNASGGGGFGRRPTKPKDPNAKERTPITTNDITQAIIGTALTGIAGSIAARRGFHPLGLAIGTSVLGLWESFMGTTPTRKAIGLGVATTSLGQLSRVGVDAILPAGGRNDASSQATPQATPKRALPTAPPLALPPASPPALSPGAVASAWERARTEYAIEREAADRAARSQRVLAYDEGDDDGDDDQEEDDDDVPELVLVQPAPVAPPPTNTPNHGGCGG